VYVLTNQVDNTVAVFNRDAHGELTPAGEFSTGGAGDPIPQGTDPATDPLASQGALILGTEQQQSFSAGAVRRFSISCLLSRGKRWIPNVDRH
jgi:hypothetical protein